MLEETTCAEYIYVLFTHGERELQRSSTGVTRYAIRYCTYVNRNLQLYLPNILAYKSTTTSD